MQVPVRKYMYDALSIAIETQVHRLAKDIASALGQPEEPLLKALKTDTIKILLHDESGDDDIEDLEDHRCQAWIQPAGSPFYQCCGSAVVWMKGTPTTLCLHHSLEGARVLPPGIPPLVRIETEEKGPVLIDSTTGHVYTEDGEMCGRYVAAKKKLTLFEVE
jgi:hypothetical protein